MEIMAVTDHLEGDLSPLQRSRCNTWPLPHPDHYASGEGTPPHHDWVDQHLPPHLHHQQPPPPPPPQQQQHQPNAAAGHFAMLHMPPHAHALPLHALAPAQYPSQGDPHADPHAAITPGGNGLPGEGALCPVGPGGGVGGGASDGGGCPSSVAGNKKSTARRNAWGGQSYADIITKAIQSSPEGRLTLAQIYDWVVQNISYFKDKGDSNSSAGWKNSIRHNLSLHNRFMRVQNEGTGKSSWWVLNPDAKPGKSTRRRANTMEGGSFVKKRGRVKKKIGIDGVRNGLDPMSSPSSSISENQDLFPDSPLTHPGTGYSQLSPQDFRPRASSNASSCGRLSPIPFEPDMHDSQVPPMSPGLGGWPSEYYPYAHPAHAHTHDRHTDQLVDSMGEGLKIGTDTWGGSGHNPNPTDCMKLSQLSPHPAHLNGYVPGHAPHHHHTQGYGSYEDYHHRFASHGAAHGLPFSPHAHQDKMPPTPRPHHSNYSLSNLQAMSPAHSVHSLSPTQPLGEGQYPGPGGEADMRSTSSFPTPPASQPNAAHSHPPPTSEPNMLRAALTHREVGGGGGGGGAASQQQSGPPNPNNSGGPTSQNGPSNTGGGGGGTGGGAGGSTGSGTATGGGGGGTGTGGGGGGGGAGGGGGGGGGSSGGGGGGTGGRGGGSAGGGVTMHDLNDLNLDALPGDLDCNVEEVIKHELQMGGNLDFTFTQNNQAHAHHAHHAHTHAHTHAHNEAPAQMGAPPAVASYTSIAAGNQWVR